MLKIKTQTKYQNHSHEVVVPDLNIPWGFVFLPDDAMLITEKAGDLFILKMEKTLIKGLT